MRQLGNISLSDEELRFLKKHCTYLSPAYLDFLKEFRLSPREQLKPTFHPVSGGEDSNTNDDENVVGDIHIEIRGKWVDTILYEIPLLALASEAYFKFMDTDWDYEGQEQRAYDKGMRLLEAGCVASEFGTRRRRDYHTQALVFRGLARASRDGTARGLPGRISGTSNVHLAMRFGIPPVGTVAHEWFMGIAAITGDYAAANEEALRRWVGCFGDGVLGIALTDTFGTPAFLRAFEKPIRYLPDTPNYVPPLPSPPPSTTNTETDTDTDTTTPPTTTRTYAEVFGGVRQDSGDPAGFVKLMRDFYAAQKIAPGTKTIVFSDALDIDRCIQYRRLSLEAGLQPTFGVGTFLTNDFVQRATGRKSVPLNIVIKLSSAAGRPAVKISDNAGKNTGDADTVREVKRALGYVERDWAGGDETARWGTADGDEGARKKEHPALESSA
ncbi:nicotinate phosphoribosyltransferase [Diatrype stigma]|uniref:nicotinate phosphoribosyltransferase n=1 Tax=Diatrype stigma TaxID=117547 RepID=A0AAN9V2V9_9PEZI